MTRAAVEPAARASRGRLIVAISALGAACLACSAADWRDDSPWEPLLPSPDRASVNALAEGAGGTLLAGTGAGLFTSDDRGASWSARGPGDWNVLSLLVTRAGSILLGTYRAGIKRSGDGGATWTSVGFEGNVYVDALLERPGGAILAGTARSVADEPTGIFRSEDDGATWVPAGLAGEHIVSISEPEPDLLYVGTEGGAFRSVDGGETWTSADGLSALAPLSAVVMADGVLFAGLGEPRYRAAGAGVRQSGDRGETWDETEGLPAETTIHDLLVVGDTVFAASGDVFGRGGAGVYRADGGQAWTLAGLDGQWVRVMLESADGARYAGAEETGIFSLDARVGEWQPRRAGLRNWNPVALVVDRDGVVIALTPRSAYRHRTSPPGWIATDLPDTAAPATPFNVTALDDGTLVFPGKQGVLFTAGAAGPWSFREIPGVEGSVLDLHAAADGRLLATFPGEGVFSTPDRGETWERLETPADTRGVFVTSTGVSIAFGSGAYRSADERAWAPVGPPGSQVFGVIECGGRLYLGSAPGGVFVSADGGRTWASTMDGPRATARQPGYIAAHSMLCLPGGGVLAATFSDGLFHLDDGRWSDVSEGLGTRGIGDLASAPDGTVYAISTSGVYRSSRWVARPETTDHER